MFSTPKLALMSSPQNVNARTIVPVINPESYLVDLDPEEDLKEIQCKVVAEQRCIKEAIQAKLVAACERIEKKRQEWKAREEEEWKV